ncbi:MAG TPA: hypothetical protein VGO57_12980 [Verrucomicrobiae bacterium]
MSSNHAKNQLPPLDLSKWRGLPKVLMVIGGILSVAGLAVSGYKNHFQEFGFSWLLAFMFFYSLALGSLFLVMIHHLTDAGWSVGIRRFCEHLASLLGWPLIAMFLPVAIFAKDIYSWMKFSPETNNLVAAKLPVFTQTGFYVTSAIFFGFLWFLSWRLSSLSLQQDKTGAAEQTYKMRFYSGWGIVALALVITFSGVLWMKAVQYEWFSCIYGVYFFSDCAWIALATVYMIAAILYRQRILAGLLQENYFYYIGLLFFGFTLFSAYTEFAQYFVVWNANMPQETFWYLIRENGNWWTLSLILILGHFFVPFFILLPVKVKSSFKVVIPVCLWAWLMHALDLAFNIFPTLHNDGYHFKWIWLPLGTMLFMGGFLAQIFLNKFNANPPYPQRDPRLLEAMGVNANLVNDLTPATNTGGNQ